MIKKDYKQNKLQVLALYDEFKKIFEESGKQISENIETQAKKIKDEVFNLMILGEAKSGKSTFINAYLGKEVVPMDVRQCTSAIIKIKRGDEYKLIAKTAGGGITTITGDESIREFLKNHAAISDKYRNIPITTINNEILIKYKGNNIPSKIMETFLEYEEKDNIFNMDIDEYNKLIKEYIEENKDMWGKIITKIEITYPLPEEMQGITLIDSPGVGAGGNVGEIAEEYIKNANAIIFVKYLKGQAIESTTFMNFLRHNCADRKKESLFLVLNGKSDLQGSEYASLMEQAIAMYKNDIKQEKIIGVDSKVKLFLNKCLELGTEEKIGTFFDELEDSGEDFAPASNCWLKSEKKGGMPYFEEKMEEMSNFRNVHAAIEKFARVANYIQLLEFLENLEKEYKRYKVLYSSMLSDAKENVDDPEALSDKIKFKKKEISEVYVKINEGIAEIYKKYTDNIRGEAIIINEAEKKKIQYEKMLENFRKLPEEEISDTTFSALKKMTFDAINDTKEFRREIANKVIEECNQKLIHYTSDPTKIPAEAYSPNFTEADFEAIDKEAYEQSSGIEEVETGLTIKRVEEKPFHYLEQHVKRIANSISNRLNDKIFPTMILNVVNYVTNCTEKYREQLTNHKKELEDEYNKLLENQKNNNGIVTDIEKYELILNKLETEISSISDLKGELRNYVEE
ncbi:dynamin family protein [Gemella sanguinis]|jgi:hypothetical protein|uniref:dynamin family protein n=1 Tax=Gemella sanguinis TaxID=84135 RepID=UPI0028CFD787|nr:dynamin family protein [Gemella sanguinis]